MQPIRYMLCIAVFIASASASSTLKTPKVYDSQTVSDFLSLADTPVLVVGTIVQVDSNLLPCTIQNTRLTAWSISKVLYGFDPGKEIKIGFGSCGPVEAQFQDRGPMLVIAYRGRGDVWVGMKQSVLPATDANVQLAQKAMRDYLRKQIRELIRPRRAVSNKPILALEGTILDPGLPRGDAPCIAKVPPSFPVKFHVAEVLVGEWTQEEVTVQFPGCGPLYGPVFHVGQPVLVFALRMQPEPPTFFHAGFLLPPEEKAQAISALKALEVLPKQP